MRLAKLAEVNPDWKRSGYELLKPEVFYPWRPDESGGKLKRLAALKTAIEVTIATERSHDPAFAEKVEDIVGLYMNPPAMPWCCRLTRSRRSRPSIEPSSGCRSSPAAAPPSSPTTISATAPPL